MGPMPYWQPKHTEQSLTTWFRRLLNQNRSTCVKYSMGLPTSTLRVYAHCYDDVMRKLHLTRHETGTR